MGWRMNVVKTEARGGRYAGLGKEAAHHLRSVQPALPPRAEERKKGPRVGPGGRCRRR